MYPTAKISFLIAAFISIIFLSSWELYWRSGGYYIPSINDTEALWADKRAELETMDSDEVVIIGSSRAHFDFQLNEWEEVTGKRPLMLATPGKSPGPILEDIVENTTFSGTLIIGCAPGLFFAPRDSTGGWRRAVGWVEYYHDRTYAQMFNFKISKLIDPNFAFITEESNEELTLKGLINRIPLKGRVEPPWSLPDFSYIDMDRNTTMKDKVVKDTAYAGQIQRAWTDTPPKVRYRDVRTQVLGFYKNLVVKFQARGGRIIFVRNPSHMVVRENEKIRNPRELYWDPLIDTTGAPGYHFEDYPELNQFFTPEWSHLSTPDAKVYTKELLKIMQEDKVL